MQLRRYVKTGFRFWLLRTVIFLFAVQAYGQDEPLRESKPYLRIATDRAWSAMNRNFLFTPPAPDSRMCIFIRNNNPTTAQTFTLAVSQTGDERVTTYANNAGRWIDDTVQGTASPVATASTNAVFVKTNAASKVALRFSGAAAAAGTPDTADVFVVFTTSDSCGAVSVSGSATTIVDGFALGQADVISSGHGEALLVATHACVISATIGDLVAGNSQIIAAVSGQRIRICKLFLTSEVAVDIIIRRGTGVSCATGQTDLSGTFQNVTSLVLDLDGTLILPVSEAFCLNLATDQVTGGMVLYAQY